MVFKIVPASREHIAPVAENVREADRLEFMRASGLDVRSCLELGYDATERNYTGLMDDKPVLMSGVSVYPLNKDVGIPWLVATKDIEHFPKAFQKEMPALLQELHKGFKGLVNYVDAENTKTIRWLKRLGFTIMEPVPYGKSGMPFRMFYIGDISGV